MRRNTDLNYCLGQTIRQYREERGLTQAQFGQLLDEPVSHAAVSDIERGVTDITVSRLYEISVILDIGPERLLREATILRHWFVDNAHAVLKARREWGLVG